MNFAIIGLGSIGKRHITNLISLGVSPSGIFGVDTRADRREEAAKKFGLGKAFDSIEALKGQKLDCVFICSPTSLHIAHANFFISQNVNLFIEKPVAHKLDDEVYDLAKEISKKGIKSLIGYVFRFSEPMKKLKEIISRQTQGKALSVRGEFSEYLPDWHPWEDYRSFYMAKKSMGGGSLLDQSHIIDLCHYLFGEIEEVAAFNGKASGLEVEADDYAEMLVRFSSGLTGTIHQDMFGREHKKFLEIKCEKGNILWNAYDFSVQLYDGEGKRYEKFILAKDHNQMYLNQTNHLLNVLRGTEKSMVSVQDALHTMAVIEAVEKSQSEKRFVTVSSGRLALSEKA